MNNPDFKDFLQIQRCFLSFTESNRIRILSKIEEIDPSNYLYLSILIVDICISRPRLVKQYIDFIFQKLGQYDLFLRIFINHLFDLASTTEREGINTINYIINQFLEHSLINQDDIIKKLQTNIYFSHILMNNKLVLSRTRNLRDDNFLRNIDEYSANDWEKHHQLINKGINPDPFAEIIFNDDVESLKDLIIRLERNPNTILQPSIYDILSFDNPINLIEYAALCGSLKCFKFLLLNGSVMKNGISYYAISGGNVEIIHICEQKGFKHKFADDLYLTIKYHNLELFKWVLQNEPSEIVMQNIMKFSNYEAIDFINDAEYPFHYYSLCQAVQFNQFIIFKALIERGVTEYSSYGVSVMNAVCSSKNKSFFEYSFENREKFHMDFTSPLKNGLTPLHSACVSGNLDIVKKLIENNADPELRTMKENSCLHFACQSNNIDMVNYIFSICDISKIDDMNDSKITPLIVAIRKQNIEIVKLVLKQKSLTDYSNQKDFHFIFFNKLSIQLLKHTK